MKESTGKKTPISYREIGKKKRHKYLARVGDYSHTKDKYSNRTIVFEEVKLIDDNDTIKVVENNDRSKREHTWSIVGTRIAEAKLKVDDRITFEARVKKYIKHHEGTNRRNGAEYKLAWVGNIKKVDKK